MRELVGDLLMRMMMMRSMMLVNMNLKIMIVLNIICFCCHVPCLRIGYLCAHLLIIDAKKNRHQCNMSCLYTL